MGRQNTSVTKSSTPQVQTRTEIPPYSRPFPKTQTPPIADVTASPTQASPANLLTPLSQNSQPSQTPMPIMPKLTVGAAGDKYEKEADAVASQVVQQLNSPASVQRVPGYGSEEENQTVRMKPMVQLKGASAGGAASPELEQSIQRERGKGQSLSESLRNPMENAFGADFSGVRIHTDNTADQLNQSIQAKAFTTGQDVFFRQGAYAPESKGGQELLAHELTHVVQQNGGGIQRQPQPNVRPVAPALHHHEQSLSQVQMRPVTQGSELDSASLIQQSAQVPTIQAARGKFGRVMSDIAFGVGLPIAGAFGAEFAAQNVFGSKANRTDVSGTRPDQRNDRAYNATAIEIKKDKKYALRGFKYSPKNVQVNSKAVILLSGSDGSNEKQLEPVADTYCQGGTTVYAIDYRGFGESVDLDKKGKESTPLMSEEGIYKDARKIYDYVTGQGFTPGNIVLHGFSLGGAVASHLAKSLAKQNIKLGGLVLHSSIDTAYRQGKGAAESEFGLPGGLSHIAGLGAKGSAGNFDTIEHLKKLAKRDKDLPIHFMSGTEKRGDQLALDKTKLQDVKKDVFTNVSSYQRAGDHLETDQHVGGNYQADYLSKLVTQGRSRTAKDKDHNHAQWG